MDDTKNIEGLDEIREWLEQVKFKKCFFGGVDEADVWKKKR